MSIVILLLFFYFKKNALLCGLKNKQDENIFINKI